MALHDIWGRLWTGKSFTPAGWTVIVGLAVIYGGVKHMVAAHQQTETPKENAPAAINAPPHQLVDTPSTTGLIPQEPPLRITAATPPPPQVALAPQSQLLNKPSFGNVVQGKKLLSEDFIPKGHIVYATLIMDIVSNNQISPVVAVVVHPVISAHKLLIPVGTRITGKIAAGNLRGRVFVNFDTIVFIDEGRQGWEVPIKGIGMTYEQNNASGRWIINGAGLKGYLYDESAANAFKLAALQGARDFLKTLETYTLTQNTVVSGASAIASTQQTPNATLQNSGLAAGSTFMDTIAQRYAATLQQQSSYVMVPTARMVAIYMDEAADITTAAPGKSNNG